MKNIAFYTFGNHQMGLGHVYRCMSIAEKLIQQAKFKNIYFIIKNFPETILLLEDWKFFHSIKLILFEDLELYDLKFHICIIDQLSVDQYEFDFIKKKTGKTVLLDDISSQHFEADVAINALYIVQSSRPAHSKTESHYGFDYIILQNSFLQIERNTNKIRTDSTINLLLTQGGADTYNLINQLLPELIPILKDNTLYTLHILSGRAYQNREELDTLKQICPPNIHFHENIPDIASFFKDIDIAITAAGITAYELAYLGIPMILATQELKEIETVELFEHHQLAISVNMLKPDSISEIKVNLLNLIRNSTLRNFLSSNCLKYVDGLGLERIINIINNL